MPCHQLKVTALKGSALCAPQGHTAGQVAGNTQRRIRTVQLGLSWSRWWESLFGRNTLISVNVSSSRPTDAPLIPPHGLRNLPFRGSPTAALPERSLTTKRTLPPRDGRGVTKSVGAAGTPASPLIPSTRPAARAGSAPESMAAGAALPAVPPAPRDPSGCRGFCPDRAPHRR